MPIFQPKGKFTAESKTRVVKYREQIERSKYEKSFDSEDYESYLKSCDLRVEIREMQDGEINRVVETLQRTNQMNATMKRLGRDEVEIYKNDSNKFVHILKLGDKFGDYGIVGVCLSEKWNFT